MGNNYPKQYPLPAIELAEEIVTSAVRQRLSHHGEEWSAGRHFVTAMEFEQIRLRFRPGVEPSEVLKFIGLVFYKVAPRVHFEFVSDGYFLDQRPEAKGTKVIVAEQRPAFSPYDRPGNEQSRAAALGAVRSLIEWRMTLMRDGINESVHFIYGDMFKWIRAISMLRFVRTRAVIEFIYEAVPDLAESWRMEGLQLRPTYHIDSSSSQRFITLDLSPA
jgi:hypothetical protein